MKKFRVLFKRSNGELRLLGYTGDVTGQEEVIGEYSPNLRNASKMINRYLTNFPNFQHYYTRINGPITDSEYCKAGERLWIYDVGSWSEFFYVIETKDEWVPNVLENTYENYSSELFTLNYPEKAKVIYEGDNE
jgi:hypothetical protein